MAGVIAPVTLFSVNAGNALYVPPVKVPVPVKLTGCGAAMSLQNGLA